MLILSNYSSTCTCISGVKFAHSFFFPFFFFPDFAVISSHLMSVIFASNQVRIREATDLPPSLAHFVFCQYTFWGQDEMTVVPPYINPELDDLPGRTKDANKGSMRFNHAQVRWVKGQVRTGLRSG